MVSYTDVGEGVPPGSISMWSGPVSDIPYGWELCDGNNGTPDLTDKFVAGAGGKYSPGDTGGAESVTLTEAQLPSHTHQNHVSSSTSGTAYVAADGGNGSDDSQTGAVGNDEPHENRPPYYAVAYIQKQ